MCVCARAHVCVHTCVHVCVIYWNGEAVVQCRVRTFALKCYIKHDGVCCPHGWVGHNVLARLCAHPQISPVQFSADTFWSPMCMYITQAVRLGARRVG